MSDIRYPYCIKCQESFPMREHSFDALERSGNTFYCPQGHLLAVRQNDIVSQLRSSQRFLQRSEDQVHRLQKRIECVKGVITRQRNRLLRRCCPYCAKSVTDIKESTMLIHIRTRHGE